MQLPLKEELFTVYIINLGCLFIRKSHNSRMAKNFYYRYVLNTQHWKANYLKDIVYECRLLSFRVN